MPTRVVTSVIIPLYNDVRRLRLCLEALVQQTYPPNKFEVIVVDNSSSEPIDSITKEFSHIKLVRELKKGSYAARNKGVAISQGKFLAFTDSDCIPAQDWLEKGIQVLQNTDADIVGGNIRLFFKEPNQPTAVELYESMFAFRTRTYIEKFDYTVTANLITTKELFMDVGPFNATLLSSGDKEWCNRAVSRGYKLMYAEEVLVAHPARHNFSELARKEKRILRGWVALTKSRGNLLYNIDLYKTFIPPLKSTLKVIKNYQLTVHERLVIVGVLWRVRILRAWYSLKVIFIHKA